MAKRGIEQHRQRSGYTRDFRASDVLVFNIVGFGLGLALSTNPPFIGAVSPGAAIGWVVASGAALALANGLVYGWFAGVMQATGGDYVYVSRTFNPALGFLVSWGFTVCQLYGLAINLGWIITVGLAPTLQTLGLVSHNAGVITLAAAVANAKYTLPLTLCLLIFYYLVYLAGTGTKRWFIFPLFVFALLGPILMAIIVSSTSHNSFVETFNAVLARNGGAANGYDAALEAAKGAGMKLDTPISLAATARALPLGFLCFIGFTYSVYVGGEVRRADRSQMIGILGALFTGAATFIYIMTAYVSMVGHEFNAALGNSEVVKSLGLMTGSMNVPIAMVAPNYLIALIMLSANLLWFLLIPYVMLQVCAHNFVAWSCDKIGPSIVLARISRTNSPWLAGLAVSIVVAAFAVLNALFGFSLLAAVSLAAVAFGITGAAAFMFPRLKPNLVDMLPSVARYPVAGITVFQWMGLLSTGGFIWIVYASVTMPDISGGSPGSVLISLVVVYFLGAIWYQYFYTRNSKKANLLDLDLDSLLREIPED